MHPPQRQTTEEPRVGRVVLREPDGLGEVRRCAGIVAPGASDDTATAVAGSIRGVQLDVPIVVGQRPREVAPRRAESTASASWREETTSADASD